MELSPGMASFNVKVWGGRHARPEPPPTRTAAELRGVKFGGSRRTALAAAVQAIAIVDRHCADAGDGELARCDSYATLHSASLAFEQDADAESHGPFAENRTEAQYACESLAEAIESKASTPEPETGPRWNALPGHAERRIEEAEQAFRRSLASTEDGESAMRLMAASKSRNTLRAYTAALRRMDAWMLEAGRAECDPAIAEHLGRMDAEGKAPTTASVLVAAVRFRAEAQDRPNPVGRMATAALQGFRRTAHGRGRGQAKAITIDDVYEVMAKCDLPRETARRGMESIETAAKRGRFGRALVGVAFQACLRRSELAALTWGDVEPASTPEALRIRVRQSKTNQEGDKADVRLVKNGVAKALLAIKPDDAKPDASVFGMSAETVARRFKPQHPSWGLMRPCGGAPPEFDSGRSSRRNQQRPKAI